jgi:hypothetical protein
VKSYSEYKKNRQLWDKIQQCVSLDADFYEGSENLLFPPTWLNQSHAVAKRLKGLRRQARTIGVDSAQGGDSTSWAVSDELGLIELRTMKTPNTAVITGITLSMMRQHDVAPENILFDAGGGGKQHADRLRAQGYNVRVVAFGESATPPRKMGMTTVKQRNLRDEDRYVYKNRRAEMYGMLHLRLEPNELRPVWAIPEEYSNLRSELAPVPLLYDSEGRLYLPPKHKKSPNSQEVTLIDLIGHSPDEADATVLSIYGIEKKASGHVAGAITV